MKFTLVMLVIGEAKHRNSHGMNDHQKAHTTTENGTRNLHKQNISRSSGTNWNHPHFDSEPIQFRCNQRTTSWFQFVPFWKFGVNLCLWFGFCGHQGCIGRPQHRRLEGREGFWWLKMKAASKMSEAILTSGTVVSFFREEFQTSNFSETYTPWNKQLAPVKNPTKKGN